MNESRKITPEYEIKENLDTKVCEIIPEYKCEKTFREAFIEGWKAIGCPLHDESVLDRMSNSELNFMFDELDWLSGK